MKSLNKTCCRCREVKPLDEFGLNSAEPDKKSRVCSLCLNTAYLARRERLGLDRGKKTDPDREDPEYIFWTKKVSRLSNRVLYKEYTKEEPVVTTEEPEPDISDVLKELSDNKV